MGLSRHHCLALYPGINVPKQASTSFIIKTVSLITSSKTRDMKNFTLIASVLAFATAVVSQGPQPCYNAVDPDKSAQVGL
jgi:hypothetical protein